MACINRIAKTVTKPARRISDFNVILMNVKQLVYEGVIEAMCVRPKNTKEEA